MLIKEEICERLSPSYRAEIKRLEKEYAKIADTNLTAKKEYLLQFSQKYLMLPEIWYECFDITDKEQQSCSDLAQLWKDKYNNRKRARKLFFVHKDANYFTKLWHHKVRLDKNFFLDKNDIISILNLPCKGIDQTWIFFDETSPSPLPEEVFLLYKKTKKLYLNILEADSSDEKWAFFVSQVNDKEYVENNFEWRIGRNLNNQKLWKIYLQYLEKNNTKLLLHVYSCYCRFFMDDYETKNAYKEAAEKYGPPIVHWKNPFNFEIYEEEAFDEKKCLSKLILYHPRTNILTKISTDNNYINQIFCFPKTLILYLIENGKANIVHKLHKSCKYFFIKYPYPVFHRLDIDHSYIQPTTPNYIEFFQQSLSISLAWYKPTSNFHFDHPFIISNSLHCETPIRNVMKNIIPFIFRCCAKYIQIHCQDLLFKEFKVLFEEGNVEKLNLSVNNIINSNGEKINLEDILELTPKLKYFEITSPKIEAETFNKLAKMKFENKFKSFILRSFINCDAYEMFEFLKKHFDKNSKFLIYFEKNTDVNIVNNILKVLEAEYQNYWKNNDGPYIELFAHVERTFGRFGTASVDNQ